MSSKEQDESFDWAADAVVEKVEAIAVYTNEAGCIVIRKMREWNEEDDTFVIFPRSAAKKIIAAIRKEVRGLA